MTQSRQARANELSDFDRLVKNTVAKSVVVAPKDPNGGAKLPVRQSNAAKRKGKGKEQYMAIFDREAQESNDQLEDWEDRTNDTTDSPDKFVNDDDDAPEDYDDQQWEDNRRSDDDGDGVYDPFSDDDEMGEDGVESLELPDDDEEYVTVKRHKRRKNGVRKSNAAARGDMDEDFADLTNDDDDLDEGDGDEDEDDERPKRKSGKKEEDGERDKSRRKEVRKALGADAMKYVDGNPLIKALTDAVWDLKDQSSSEIRALALDVRKLRQENAALRTLVQKENRQMVKSLMNGQMQIAGYEPADQAQAPQQRAGQPVRKGYGVPVATTQRPVPQEFDLAKAFEVLEAEYQKPGNDGGDPQIMNDITILDNNRVAGVPYLSNAGKEVLHKAGLF